MQSNTTKRNIWAQLGVSACALLLPPIALGTAVYSLLPTRDEGAGRSGAGAVAEVHAAGSKLRIDSAQPWPPGTDSQSVARTNEPIPVAGWPAPPAESRGSVPATGARQQPPGKFAKDMARVSDPVTAALPPAGINTPPPADPESAPTGSIDMRPDLEPSRSAVMELSTSLLPRALAPPIPPPRRIPLMTAAQAPAVAGLPSAENPPAPPPARKHSRRSYLANLSRHNGARAEARSEAVGVRRGAQQSFSLKNWLQQLGTGPRN